ncbi:DNA polymerase III subunit alpha [Fulvivirga lutimaris]|uniref:DNA polymerase III subunit alpha n=1 Tax=Fulvivirga lutimaris TaxID=1819566 RepID=UPI0012BD1D4F|nr:PHP domain-containing protein [Fulvivirga lutimaris]MTI39259.1 DNA polymerase III subunit alpha [Fulvivirga lutimaris]
MYLNTHSSYSFKHGVINPKELLAQAEHYGVAAMALTDINSTSGSLIFVREAQKCNVKPVLGIDFRNGANQQFVGIAKNNKGFQELNELLSYHLHNNIPIPEKAPFFKNAFVIYPFNKATFKLRKNEFVGIKPSNFSKLWNSPRKNQPEKLVAFSSITFRHKRDFNTHRLLRAIDNNTLLSKLPKTEEGSENDRFLSPDQLKEVYTDYPYLLKNAEMLLDQCNIHFNFSTDIPQNLKTYTGSEDQDFKLLRRLCLRGMPYRYPQGSLEIMRRLVKELQIIKQKKFVSYFLINCKIINYARKRKYYYVGRGSGANSIVAYLLRITDVDPIELDLYFERFINLYRQNPPDFDIDFSSRDRDDVTRFIFEYFNKKSPNGVALLATFSTFKAKATIRELGKVFGLPAHEIEKMAEGGQPSDAMAATVLKYSSYIANLPSHLSIHAGGVLIANRPIQYFTATSLPPKGFPTTHFDMHLAEDVGLYKFDILAQRGLGKIKDCLALIKENCPDAPDIDIHDFKSLKKDPRIKELLREAQAIGCFYVESPAMRMLLRKLRADEYLGLVAASSIIRPGVAKSGMMRQYIVRFREPERRNDAHPVLRDIMPDTYGIMVYQEDVIKVAHHFAGLDLGEADVLRRGMSGKFRSRDEFQQVKEKFFSNCLEKKYSREITADVWRQIESFAGYAFAKGHSASYAVESYQSLFLKAYFPLEYMVATINNGGGFYRVELYVHEARMHGAEIFPPCVNKSAYDTRIYGKDIYLGFGLVLDLEVRVIERLVADRERQGKYVSLEDFVSRVEISLEQLTLLIRVGAFRFTGVNKKELLWKAHFLLGNKQKPPVSTPLFKVDYKRFMIPKLSVSLMEDAFDEMELIGFPLCHPFSLLDGDFKSTLCTKDLKRQVGKVITILGYLIAIKNTSTSKGKRMNFGTFIDLEGQFIDTVHFPPTAERWPFRGRGVYTITGKVVEEYDFPSIEVMMMEKERYIDDPRYFVNSGNELNI